MSPLEGPTTDESDEGSKSTLIERVRTALRLRNLYLLRVAMRFAPSETQRLYAITLLIGALSGLAAVAFHLTIMLLERLLVDRAMNAPNHSWIAWTIFTPTAGAVVCGLLMTFVVRNARGSGVPQVKVAFAAKNGRVRLRDAIGKFFISALQIGSGSSLGREGPTVQICAGIASTLGRVARVSPKNLRRLLPVGTAAGIAAAFNAPIAAVTFTIEEVVGKLDQAMLSGVIIAAALAAVIERSALGVHPIFAIPQSYELGHASSLLVYGVLGIAAALVSILFTDFLLALRGRLKDSRVPEWVRPGIGGVVTGGLAVVAWWALHSRGVTGGGYDTLGIALAGRLTVRVMLVLCAMKIIATVFSYASGGSGGLFAPALFIGGMLGGAFGSVDAFLFPSHASDPIGAFALVGMGAVFSGVIRAPMTSVLIIIEMTGGYSLILPLMIANMTAYALARARRPMSIYEALLAQDGIHLEGAGTMDVLEGMQLRRLVNRTIPFRSFRLTTSAAEMLSSMAEEPKQNVFPVLDGTERVVGVISTHEVSSPKSAPADDPNATAAARMRPPPNVSLDDDLRSALDAMMTNGLSQLPIVDEHGKCVALVSEADIATAYLHQQRGTTRQSKGTQSEDFGGSKGNGVSE
ncbi:MAG: chloride channel protein [Polyangiaceae bacterium]